MHNYFHIYSYEAISGFLEKSYRGGMVLFLPNNNVIKNFKLFTVISLGPKELDKTGTTISWILLI